MRWFSPWMLLFGLGAVLATTGCAEWPFRLQDPTTRILGASSAGLVIATGDANEVALLTLGPDGEVEVDGLGQAGDVLAVAADAVWLAVAMEEHRDGLQLRRPAARLIRTGLPEGETGEWTLTQLPDRLIPGPERLAIQVGRRLEWVALDGEVLQRQPMGEIPPYSWVDWVGKQLWVVTPDPMAGPDRLRLVRHRPEGSAWVEERADLLLEQPGLGIPPYQVTTTDEHLFVWVRGGLHSIGLDAIIFGATEPQPMAPVAGADHTAGAVALLQFVSRSPDLLMLVRQGQRTVRLLQLTDGGVTPVRQLPEALNPAYRTAWYGQHLWWAWEAGLTGYAPDPEGAPLKVDLSESGFVTGLKGTVNVLTGLVVYPTLLATSPLWLPPYLFVIY